MTVSSWDEAYAGVPAPWDIGVPQPAFARLAEQGLLSGRVLDSGCGTGEHALLAAAHGADAVGVDVSGRAIRRARDKAAERGLAVRFEVGDVLRLGDLGLAFDTIIDSGVFHVFDDEDRARYVASLASVLRPGGAAAGTPATAGPPGRRTAWRRARAACRPGWPGVTPRRCASAPAANPRSSPRYISRPRRHQAEASSTNRPWVRSGGSGTFGHHDRVELG